MGIEFDQAYEEWMNSLLEKERNHRVRSRIENGLEHGTLEILRTVWFPVVKNFHHLYPEWEVCAFQMGTGIWIWHTYQVTVLREE